MRDRRDLGNAQPTRAFARLGPYLTSYARCSARSRKRKICAAFVTHGLRETPRPVWDSCVAPWLLANDSGVEDNICATFLGKSQRDRERSSVQRYGTVTSGHRLSRKTDGRLRQHQRQIFSLPMKTKLNRLIPLICAAVGFALLAGCGTMPVGGSGGHQHRSSINPTSKAG